MVIDVQKGVVAGAHQRDTVVANIAALVDTARAQGAPVVWVQHSDEGLKKGSEDWEYVAELPRRESEPLVHKTYGDSFEGTDLEEVLAAAASDTWWSPGPRRTPASGPRSTARSYGDTT